MHASLSSSHAVAFAVARALSRLHIALSRSLVAREWTRLHGTPLTFVARPPAHALCAASAAACAPRGAAPPPSVPRVPLDLGVSSLHDGHARRAAFSMVVARRA